MGERPEPPASGLRPAPVPVPPGEAPAAAAAATPALAAGEERLTGVLERIVFANEQSGFSIARLKVPHQRDLTTILGPLVGSTPGEHLELLGRWEVDRKFGRQFRFRAYQTVRPTTLVGIEKYLGSGLIKGIGPVYAARLVEAFGLDTLRIVEEEPGRLRDVAGIGPRRAEKILAAWAEQKVVREVMVFLQGHGVSTAHAARIFRTYGEKSLDVLRTDPYRMVEDVWGIGFRTADQIALKLGLSEQSERRAEAGLAWVLQTMLDEGHCFCPRVELLARGADALRIDLSILERALGVRLEAGALIDDEGRIYLGAVHAIECKVAERLRLLLRSPSRLPPIRLDAALAWAQGRLSIQLSPSQVDAIRRVLQAKVSVLTGGPGVGKTTIVTAVLAILRAKQAKVLLCAPTGKAAKRLSEVTGTPASTIHRLLKFRPRDRGFEFNAENPLDADLVVMDESSMVDIFLLNHLLQALRPEAALLLVGDVDQLPSVGPGNCLRDIIDSGSVSASRLTEIFRQAAQSDIVANAHRINRGEMPLTAAPAAGALSDFYFIEEADPERIPALVVKLCKERIPARFGLDPVRDVQVLTPMYRGAAGVTNLNLELQKALNPTEEKVLRFGREYRVGDKVMQLRNNYDLETWNGDIGVIRALEPEAQEVTIEFDGRPLQYGYGDLDEVTHAYACSVHKSQGSEYPAVILLLLTQHFIMLQRNLLYTALTRARRLAVVVGTKKALGIAVRNNDPVARYTGLKERLAGKRVEPGPAGGAGGGR